MNFRYTERFLNKCVTPWMSSGWQKSSLCILILQAQWKCLHLGSFNRMKGSWTAIQIMQHLVVSRSFYISISIGDGPCWTPLCCTYRDWVFIEATRITKQRVGQCSLQLRWSFVFLLLQWMNAVDDNFHYGILSPSSWLNL